MLSKYSRYISPILGRNFKCHSFCISIACLVLIIQAETSTAQVESSGPEVETSVGVIRGLQTDDGDYSMFLGIPYARVNRSNPFGVATPITYFEGGFDAIDDSLICPQEEEFNFTITGTLDCLDLNVYVSNPVSATNKLPVMLYIFGGRFQLGFAGRYILGPSFLVRHDIILVTVNFRLGIYGFLNLHTPEVPGNVGIKDQLIAMRWVKQNIQYFGGDPDDVTLFGHSSGASSVDYHFYSEQEQLYSKIILQSASALIPLAVVSSSAHRDQFLQLTEYLGLVTYNVDEAIEYLAQLDELLVIKACLDLDLTFNPTIESYFPGVDQIIKNHSIFLDIPKAKNVSVMTGFTNGEVDASFDTVNLEIFDSILTGTFNIEGKYLEKMMNIVRKFYIGDETELTSKVRYALCDAMADLVFVYPIARTINKLLENNVKNLYQYYFKYLGGRNFVHIKDNLTTVRAAHADELGYLFDMSYLKNNGITTEDQLIIDRFTTLWTNFAKYGEPTPTVSPLLPVRWLPVTSENSYYYTIDTEVSLASAPYHNRKAFWDLFYLYNEKFQLQYFNEAAQVQVRLPNGEFRTIDRRLKTRVLYGNPL